MVEKEKTKRSKSELILNICLIFAVVLCIAVVVVRMFWFAKIEVRQQSMSPTFLSGEHVWINKLIGVERGCVVVFYEEPHEFNFWDAFVDDDKKLIKRVVGVEGDKIWVVEAESGLFGLQIKCGKTGEVISEKNCYFRNGKDVDIPLTQTGSLGILLGTSADKPYVVPEGHFFAIGDNRNDSADSRGSLGAVPYSQVLGVVI